MMPVRCRHCGRAPLPVVPGTEAKQGTLNDPVAHVRGPQQLIVGLEGFPCWEGGSRDALIAATERDLPAIRECQSALFVDDSLWEL